jgi:hypothetical protein
MTENKSLEKILSKMKDSNSIFQITLLKAFIVIYFLFISFNSINSSDSFFYDNAEFGFWTFISFFLISGFILFIDIVIILLVTKLFKNRNKRVYILIFQSIICIVVYFYLNYSFKNADKWNENAINNSQPLQTDSTDKQLYDIYIKDKSQYDQTFIDGLADYNEPIKLIDNYIVTGKDTTYFPEDLSLNKVTTFKATNGYINFLLTVTRINLTTLTYNFQLIDKENKIIKAETGKAILGSMFFLASENDEDSQTGDSYGSCEYWDKTNDCWFAIRVGIGNDENSKQRAMLNSGCNDKSKHHSKIEEYPTLRTE